MVNKYRKVGNYINKVLFTAVLTLILLILLKSNNDFKTDFYKQVYDTNISFSKNLSVYKKYFGSLIPEDNTKAVFQENLDYTDRTSYLEGVSLSVGNGYLVPAIDSGLVINIGEKEDDPVIGVTDLLVHLSQEQLEKKGNKMIEGEALDLLVGNRPLPETEKDAVKARILDLLKEQYGMEEDDFISAELEIVPAGNLPVLVPVCSGSSIRHPVQTGSAYHLADADDIQFHEIIPVCGISPVLCRIFPDE